MVDRRIRQRGGWTDKCIWFAVGAFYCGLTLLFFAPALGHLSSKFIGDGGDGLAFFWNGWWISESLLQMRNPYFCDMQFAPFGVPLVYHSLSLIPSLVMALLGKVASDALAYNLVVIGLYPVAGLCAFALARRVTGDSAGALAGGVLFMLCPYMASKSIGHLNLLCAGLLPLYTLCLLVGLRRDWKKWRWRLAAVFLVMLFSNLHTTVFAANVTLWCLLYRGFRSKHWKCELLRFRRLLTPVLVIGVLWGSVVVYYTAEYHLRPKPYWNLSLSPELLSFVLPLHANSLWRTAAAPAGDWGRLLGNIELSVYLGWFAFPLALGGWWLRRKATPMKFMGVIFAASLLLAAGHKLQWGREVVSVAGLTVYLPMGLYRYLPVFGAVGQAGRYMIIGYMAMAVGVAALVAYVGRRFGSRLGALAAAVAIGLICVDYAFRPLLTDVPQCAITAGEGRVMDPRLGNARSLYDQTHHGRELVGGYVARIPKWTRRRYEELDGIGWFFTDHRGRQAPPPREEILDGLRSLEIRYICVDRESREQAVLAASGLRVLSEDSGGVTFIVDPPPDREDHPGVSRN